MSAKTVGTHVDRLCTSGLLRKLDRWEISEWTLEKRRRSGLTFPEMSDIEDEPTFPEMSENK